MKNQYSKLVLLVLLSSCSSPQESTNKDPESTVVKHCFSYGDIDHCYTNDSNGIKLQIYEGDELIDEYYL